MIKNKRADIESILIFIVTMTALAVFLIIVYSVTSQVKGAMLNNTMLNNSEPVRDVLGAHDTDILAKFDYLYFILFAGLCLSIIIISFFIDSHPIFIPVYIIFFGISILIGVIMSRVYNTVATNVNFTSAVAEFPIMAAVYSNWIKIIIAIGVISMVIIFGKRRASRI